MNIALEDLIQKLNQDAPTHIAGAVKSLPLRELLKNGRFIQDVLEHKRNGLSYEKSELERIHRTLQAIITKRVEVAHKLIARFSETPPEVIALNNSIFALVPSHDMLEDVKAAQSLSEQQLLQLTRASENILEAVNIEIQQRFYELTPELIAVHYTGETLDSYRKLLKNLLPQIEVGSDIFKVYSIIIRNIIKGSWIYESKVNIARSLCQRIFQTDPPDFEAVFSEYSVEELESSASALRETLAILEHDITGRPSIQDFTHQCKRTLTALSLYFILHKKSMRKAIRVLQLSHHINSFLSTENVSENATTSLMICLQLFEDIQIFLRQQQKHLDVALNLKSLEDAHEKVKEALRYRQFSIAQLLQDISILGLEDLTFISKKYLEENHILLQEIQHLIEKDLDNVASPPQPPILELQQLLQENVHKLDEAMTTRRLSAEDRNGPHVLEVDAPLPTLSRLYDKEMIRLIHKAYHLNGRSIHTAENGDQDVSFPLSPQKLREFIDTFIHILNTKKTQT